MVSSTINWPCFFKKASVFIFSDELAAVLECLKKSIILTREEGLPLSRRISDTRLGSAFLDSFKYPVCHLLSPSPVTVSAFVDKYWVAAPTSITVLQKTTDACTVVLKMHKRGLFFECA